MSPYNRWNFCFAKRRWWVVTWRCDTRFPLFATSCPACGAARPQLPKRPEAQHG